MGINDDNETFDNCCNPNDNCYPNDPGDCCSPQNGGRREAETNRVDDMKNIARKLGLFGINLLTEQSEETGITEHPQSKIQAEEIGNPSDIVSPMKNK